MFRGKGRSILWLSWTVPVVLLSAACSTGSSSASGARGSYNIVAISDLSGSQAANEGPAAYGVKAYIQMINDSGGVNGHKINLSIGDSQTSATGAAAAVRQAVSRNPLAIVMGGISTELPASAPIATKLKIPVIANGPDSSFYPPEPYIYAAGATAFQEAYVEAALLSFLAKNKGITNPRVAVPVVVSSFGDSMVTALKALQKKFGYQIVGVSRTPLDATTFNSDAAAIAALHPDFILGAENPLISPVVMSALQADNITAPFIDYAQAFNPAVFNKVQDPDWYSFEQAQFPSAPGMPAMQSAAKAAGVTQYQTTTFFTLGWIGAELAVDAIKTCGDSCTPDKVNSALERTSVDGAPYAFGPIGFSNATHTMISTLQAYHWQSGSIVAAGDPLKVDSTPADLGE